MSFFRSVVFAFVGVLISAVSSPAEDAARVFAAADRHFGDMPEISRVRHIAGHCGADAEINPFVSYCTSQNVVFLSAAGAVHPASAYLVAHVFGHAVQVRHGVADVALATIRSRRSDETALRADVTRQVECIAGVLVSLASIDAKGALAHFEAEPFSGRHWGRNPLAVGPQVQIGLKERADWFDKGFAAKDPKACGTKEFPADLLVEAFTP